MAVKKKYNSKSPFLENLLKADLSPISKKIYMERWKVILQHNQKDVFTVLTKPKATIDWIHQTYESAQTRKSYFSAVLAMFRHNDGLKEQEAKAYQVWYDAFSKDHQDIENRYRKNEPTQKQIDGYVEFEEIVKKRDELPKGSLERLLLAFYTYIPPLRCDLNHVRITAEAPSDDTPNYILLKKPQKVATLVLTEFKTAKHMDAYRKDLPAALVEELLESLKKQPREYLFMDRDNKPYRASSFIKWANRVLKRLFDKPLTISLIRHSFINTLDFNTLTVEEKENIARDMAHTTGMQDRYRLIFKKAGSVDV